MIGGGKVHSKLLTYTLQVLARYANTSRYANLAKAFACAGGFKKNYRFRKK